MSMFEEQTPTFPATQLPEPDTDRKSEIESIIMATTIFGSEAPIIMQ